MTEETYTRDCEQCGKQYTAHQGGSCFCSQWCGALFHKPARPDCIAVMLPVSAARLGQYSLAGVAPEEQSLVLDPEDDSWMFLCRTKDVAAMKAWLSWYHRSRKYKPTSNKED